ncbi:hypothetical protein C9J85_18400 [Haloferax sp. wsp5]|nr:hypothetical protein C9J85_18400 [Haloferax sp. wsp5]
MECEYFPMLTPQEYRIAVGDEPLDALEFDTFHGTVVSSSRVAPRAGIRPSCKAVTIWRVYWSSARGVRRPSVRRHFVGPVRDA